ncbi:MAG: DUF4258 domain-containing protein [Bdellovibrionota bacterium]
MELLKKVKSAVESGNYLDSTHAIERQAERKILRPEMEDVLKNGWHEKSKDHFKSEYQAWNYAIRGKTMDEKEIRVIVSFENKMLIITAIDLSR